jgi:hypothetical protein
MMVLVGVCLGVVLSATQIPIGGRLDGVAGAALAISGAAITLLVDPANLAAGVAYAFSLLLSYAIFAARRWQKALPGVDKPVRWFFYVALIRPNYLRGIYIAAIASETRETSVQC